MKEYIHITVSEHTNGYLVTGYSSLKGLFDEVCEDRLGALKIIHSWAEKEVNKEYKQRFGGL